MIAIFPAVSNTTIGLRSVDPGLAAYFRMDKAGQLGTLRQLRIPGALPFFLAGLRISSSLALVGAVVTAGRSAGRPSAVPSHHCEGGSSYVRAWQASEVSRVASGVESTTPSPLRVKRSRQSRDKSGLNP